MIRSIAFLMLALLSVSLNALAEDHWSRLSPDQQEQLKNGSPVVVTRDSGRAYPDLWIYQLADSRPEEAMAVFYDYEHHKDYTPYVVDATILSGKGLPNSLVEWYVRVPGFGNQHSTYTHEIAVADCVYQMSWSSVRAPFGFKSEISTIEMEPVSIEGRERPTTLMVYFATVEMEWWTPIVYSKKRFVKAYLDTLAALVDHVPMVREQDPALLDRELADLRRALGQSCATP